MIFQIGPSQTQGLPLAGNQEGWVGRQNEFGDVTHAMPVMHGAPSCNDDACKTRFSNLQGEKDRLEASGKELSDEVMGLHSATNVLQWKLTKSESTVRTLDQALTETQLGLANAHLRISTMTNERVRLVTEKNGLDHLSTETLKKLNNAYRVITGHKDREKTHKTAIAALKKGILPMENQDEEILTDIEKAPVSNTNVMTGKRPGDIISSPSSVKAAKTAKKTDVKELPQRTRSVPKRRSTGVSKSLPNQENKKKALNNRSQKGDSNDERTGNMPPEHQARSEVPDHNIPDMNISEEMEIGSLGAGGSGTQSGEGGSIQRGAAVA